MNDPVTVSDGKYTFFIDNDRLLNCLRYGEPWPAFRATGAHLSGSQLALYHDLLAARTEAARLRQVIKDTAMAAIEEGRQVHPHVLSPWSRTLQRIVEGE